MNLLLATPTMHRTVTAGYACTVAAVGQVCAKHGIHWGMDMCDTSFIVDARNELVGKFLSNPDRTHLLMIDSDSELGFAAVEKLITSGHAFASLPFCTRQIDLKALGGWAQKGHSYEASLAGALKWCVDLDPDATQVVNGWVKARRTGFGAVLLQRHVLEGRSGWFDRMQEGDTLLSEDMSFCERVATAAKPMLCVDQLTHHNGTFSFGARLIDDPRYFAVNL